MSQYIAVITHPAKANQSIMNCKVTCTENEVKLKDRASSSKFQKVETFTSVFDDFSHAIEEGDLQKSKRIISICNEKSTPSINQLQAYTQQQLAQYYPKQGKCYVSFGYVYDNCVVDTFNLKKKYAPQFEFVETLSIKEASDLIDVGFESLKKNQDSVFVFRIGTDPFFEWVIIPNVDTYVEKASMSGMPTNHKLVHILKQSQSYTPSFIEKLSSMCMPFRLIADSFDDIDTTWTFHFVYDVPFISNVSIMKLYENILKAKKCKLNQKRSELFVIPKMHSLQSSGELSALDSLMEDDLPLSAMTTDEEYAEIEQEEMDLEKALRNLGAFSDSDNEDSPERSTRNSSNENDSAESFKKSIEKLDESLFEEEDISDDQLEQQEKAMQYEEDYSENEEIVEEEDIEILVKDVKLFASNRVEEEDKPDDTIPEITEEDEMAAYLAQRRQGASPGKKESATTSPKEKSKSKEQFSLRYSEERLRIRKDEEDEHREEEDYSIQKDEIKERRKNLNKLLILAYKALSYNENNTEEEISQMQEKIQEGIKTIREDKTVEDRFAELHRKKRELQQKHNTNQKDIKMFNTLLVALRSKNLERAQKAGVHKKTEEYEIAYQTLTTEISDLEKEIAALKRQLP